MVGKHLEVLIWLEAIEAKLGRHLVKISKQPLTSIEHFDRLLSQLQLVAFQSIATLASVLLGAKVGTTLGQDFKAASDKHWKS